MVGQARFRALGTGVHVVTAEPGGLGAAREAVEAELRAIDEACSRFREDSEVRRLERGAGTEVPVSPLLSEALDVAIRAARITGGLLDPTVGTLIESLGYDRDFAEVINDERPLAVTVSWHPAWREITLDRARGTVRVPRGVRIDLGSTAKALAADRAAAAAADAARGGVLVNVGGDLAFAGDPPPDGWAVWVTDDHAGPPGAPGETVVVRSGGLATSSTTVRAWSHRGIALHHIVDPRTSRPAVGPYRTVSVAAATCVDGNIAASTAIILGAAAPGWLQGHGLPARLVRHGGGVEYMAGWPAPAAGAAA